LLGTACARRLLAAGFEVHGYDVDAGKREALAGLGARAAASVAAIVQACRSLVLCVFDTQQVRQVVEEIGAALHPSEPRAVICCSTCDPDELAQIAEAAQKRGLQFVEMPISGSSGQVAAGDGVGFVAGSGEAREACAAILEAICPRRTELERFGDPLRAKLAINLILGLNRAALAEGLVLAERLGLDLARFLESARNSAAYSQAMDVKGAMMTRRQFTPAQGRVAQSLKDFRLMLAQAHSRGQALPFANLYAAMLEDCVRQGEAQWDNAAILEAIRRQGGGGP
jgi:L-threonate 2-dehydrogenase